MQPVQGISSTAPLPNDIHRQLVAPAPATATGSAAATGTGTGTRTGTRTGSGSGLDTSTSTSTSPPFLTRLLQIYGSSETAGLAWRDDPARAYQLAPGRTREATGGILLQLPSGARVAMAVQDELEWISDNAFRLIRRTDNMVQVGGNNVSCDWVASKLQSHSAVKHAAVRLGRAGRLKAYVVLHQADDLPGPSLVEAWARAELPDYACPQLFTYGSKLPINSFGKSCDWPAD